MFTVGIFTTHIPYIAFVVFYAFFFLFGVDTSAKQEVQISQNKFNIELQTSQSHADTSVGSNFHYQTDIDFSIHTNFAESLVKRKLNHQCKLITAHWQNCSTNSLFSRPPPFLVWFYQFLGQSAFNPVSDLVFKLILFSALLQFFLFFYSFDKSTLW